MNTHGKLVWSLVGTLVVAGTTVRAQEPKEEKAPEADFVYVKMSTTLGDFTLELNQGKAPKTVENFLGYVDAGFYEGTMFHRVIKGFMIQGGGMTVDYTEKETRPSIDNEANNGLANVYGTIAMARTQNPHSATSQFFINVKDNDFLNHRDTARGWGYCVFGKVVEGIETIEAIANTPVHKEERADAGQPAAADTPVVINKVTRLNPADITELVKKRTTERATEEAAAKEKAQADQKAAAEAKEKAMTDATAFIKGRGVDPAGGKFTDSGLWVLHVTEGEGAIPLPTEKVKVHYTGWLTDGTEFDSSLKRNNPATFGLNQVIKGWTEGVGMMKAGGKAYLVIPPDLAYGAQGRPSIPPNSTLIFEIDLLEIVK